MGTWGPAIFDSDLACDLRAELRDLVAEGVDDPTARLLARWHETLADPEDGPVALLALAEASFDLGRLDPGVRDRALAAIAAGADLARFEADLAPARAKALAALARKLRRAPPKPKRVARREKHATALEAGDLVAIRLPAGRWVALLVFDHHQDKGGRYPVVDVLDWVGTKKPGAAVLKSRRASGAWYKEAPHWREHTLCLAGLRSRSYVVATGVPRPDASHLGPPVAGWGFERLERLESALRAWHKLKV